MSVAKMTTAVPVLRVVSVARSMAWYAETLGFAADPAGPPSDPSFAILRRGTTELMLQKIVPGCGGPRSSGGEGGWDVYLRVDDVLAFRAALAPRVANLGPIEKRIYGCRELVVHDPDEYVLVL